MDGSKNRDYDMTDEWVLTSTIVPDGHVELARLLAATIAGPTGAGMWKTAVSTTGNPPPVAFVTQGPIRKQFADLLPHTSYQTNPPTYRPGNPGLVAQLANAHGVPVIEAQVQAMFDAVDISDQPVWDALARLGYQLVESPE